jgi:hypothetical protein
MARGRSREITAKSRGSRLAPWVCMPTRLLAALSALLVLLALCACGGGGAHDASKPGGGSTVIVPLGPGMPTASTRGSGTGSGASSTSSTSSNGGTTSGTGVGSVSTTDEDAGNAGSDAGAPAEADAGGGSDPSDPLSAARAQCVMLINMYRATLSPPSPPLTEAPESSETCVDGQAQADYTANTPHSAFTKCGEDAQDECPGWPGPPSAINTGCLAQMWAEGPPPPGQDNHWLNMENPQSTQVACGFYQDPDGTWWATQDFW